MIDESQGLDGMSGVQRLSVASSVLRVGWVKAESRTCPTAVGVDRMVFTAIPAVWPDGSP